MKAFIGLGNIGDKYERTPHNAGFMFVDMLYDFLAHMSTASCGGCMCAFKGKFAAGNLTEWKNEKIFDAHIAKMKSIESSETLYLLVKPTTLMNLSGTTVRKISDKFEFSIKKDLYVVYDDLDIKLGKYKVSNKSPQDHKGVNDVIKKLGRSDFKHIRIGIDNRDSVNKIPGEDYVLKKYNDQELDILYKVILEIISDIFK